MPNELDPAITEQIHSFVVAFIDQHGFPPTRREINAGTGRHNATVRKHLHRLAEQGYLSITGSIARGITVERPYPPSAGAPGREEA